MQNAHCTLNIKHVTSTKKNIAIELKNILLELKNSRFLIFFSFKIEILFEVVFFCQNLSNLNLKID